MDLKYLSLLLQIINSITDPKTYREIIPMSSPIIHIFINPRIYRKTTNKIECSLGSLCLQIVSKYHLDNLDPMKVVLKYLKIAGGP